MEPTPLRVYLAGRVCLEVGAGHFGPAAFPGQQGRLVFAFLVAERSRPVARSELTELLWPDGDPPPSRDAALSAVVSKLRALLRRAGAPGVELTAEPGSYELRLPRGSWVDLEAAADAVHDAEAALRAGDPARAYGPSAVAHHIARRPFFPGWDAAWVERRREKLRGILLRALECRAQVYLWNRECALAVEAARDAVALAPFRETAYQLLMRAHAAAGNAAEALRVYERCRSLLSDELGVDPSPQTKAVHREVLATL